MSTELEPQVTPPPVITEEAPRELTEEEINQAAIDHVLKNNLVSRIVPTAQPAQTYTAQPTPPPVLPRYIADTTIREPLNWEEMNDAARMAYIARAASEQALSPVQETLQQIAQANGKRLLNESPEVAQAVRTLFPQAAPGEEWKYVDEENIGHLRIFANGLQATRKGPSFGEIQKPAPGSALPSDYEEKRQQWVSSGWDAKFPFNETIYKQMKEEEQK